MKKSFKIVVVLILMVMIVSMVSPVFAASTKTSTKTSTSTSTGTTSVTDPSSLTGEGTSEFDSIGKKIIGMVQAIGSIVSVLVLVILGIKYMMGSAEEKAEYKKTMIPYLVGAILIFAAANIASMIYGFANNI